MLRPSLTLKEQSLSLQEGANQLPMNRTHKNNRLQRFISFANPINFVFINMTALIKQILLPPLRLSHGSFDMQSVNKFLC